MYVLECNSFKAILKDIKILYFFINLFVPNFSDRKCKM